MTWDAEAAVVIVGAGTAGCVLANRLSEKIDRRVVLLEAGGGDSHPLIRMPMGFLKALARPEFAQSYTSEPEPALDGRVLPIPRGRLLGGSSSVNGMFHIRSRRLDFDGWARAGCTGVRLRVTPELVLAGGAYGSPQLLMRSGVGSADELQRHGIAATQHLPGVSANLIEQPRMPLQFRAKAPITFIKQLRVDRAALSVPR